MQDERFNGHWILFSAKPNLPEIFSYRVTDGVGVCTNTNAPGVFKVGDVIFRVETVWGNRFHAQQMFTDGSWHRCSGVLADGEMRFEGNYWEWVMVKDNDAQQRDR
jgi:hypothetical protein